VRVAYYSPLPPQRSGIAGYTALLLPALRRRAEVITAHRLRPRPHADVALYQLGNDSEVHGWIYDALRRRPGVVVFHEVSLHALVAGLTLGRGDRDSYLAAVERDAGAEGRAAAERALAGLEPPLWETHPAEIPLLAEALEHAEAVLVHSAYAERKVRATGYHRAVHRVPYPAPSSAPLASFSLPSRGSPVIGSLGKVNSAKRLPQLFLAFARLRRSFPEALLVLAGEGSASEQVRLRLERLGLEEGRDVLLLDYVTDDDFLALAARCDVCVSLRSPTLGETSASAIAALAVGTPLVVSDVGWFSELPGSVAARVPPDEWEVDHVTAVLELLATDDALRAGMAEAGQSYVRRELDVERSADAYYAALAELVRGEPVPEAEQSAGSVET
jgi:glycosyltransferase involved in cell wall biosynthesis